MFLVRQLDMCVEDDELQDTEQEGKSKGSSVEAQLAESVAGQISWQSV